MPELEALFPRAVEHLVHHALEKQASTPESQVETPKQAPESRLGLELGTTLLSLGIPLRRPHWSALAKLRPRGEVLLPGHWSLKRTESDQWILTRNKE